MSFEEPLSWLCSSLSRSLACPLPWCRKVHFWCTFLLVVAPFWLELLLTTHGPTNWTQQKYCHDCAPRKCPKNEGQSNYWTKSNYHGHFNYCLAFPWDPPYYLPNYTKRVAKRPYKSHLCKQPVSGLVFVQKHRHIYSNLQLDLRDFHVCFSDRAINSFVLANVLPLPPWWMKCLDTNRCFYVVADAFTRKKGENCLAFYITAMQCSKPMQMCL